MKVTTYVLASMVLSLFLHVILLFTLADLNVQAHPNQWDEQQIKSHRPPHVRMVRLEDLVKPPEVTPEQEPDPTLAAARAGAGKELTELSRQVTEMQELFQKENLAPTPPKPVVRFAGVDKAVLKPILPDTEPERQATAPRPQIIEIDVANLPAPQRVIPRPLTPKLERMDVADVKLPSLLAHGPLTTDKGATYDVGIKLGGTPRFGVPGGLEDGLGDDDNNTDKRAKNLLDELANDTPGLPNDDSPESNNDFLDPTILSPDDNKDPEARVAFDAFVDVDVQVLPRRGGAGGYFLVSIKPRPESETMRDIPKDTLFLIDHSTSISPGKLRQFKAATTEALHYLNPDDGFNVVGFTSSYTALFQDYQKMSDQTRLSAEAFIRNMVRGGMTDVFNGVAPFVRKSNSDALRPLNVFVLTDGQSTINIHASDVFLRQIASANPGNVSIFPFSAGKDANRQLLDFLGYLNRGYNYHVEDLKDFKQNLVNYISTHTSLIIADMRYTAEGNVARELYPKALPHLYRRDILRLYGVYGPHDEELVLTLYGRDATGKVRDLVFRRRYDSCKQADAQLAGEWAGQKILHMLSEKMTTESPDRKARLDREIQNMATEYGVYVPY